MHPARLAAVLCALCPVLLHAPALRAAPNDYVVMPTVEEGEKEIDFKWGIERLRHGQGSGTATSIGLGWGATSWWFTELYAKYKREPGSSSGFDAWEWENRFQLTETGRFPIDIGFLFEIERPEDRSEGYELTYGPLLQSEWGKLQGNLNLLIQRHIDVSQHFDTELHYQAQVKYRESERFEWGAQAFGSFGQWDDWARSSKQEHKLGPAIFGKFRTGAKQAIKYNAALLFGATDATARTTFRIQTEYEF